MKQVVFVTISPTCAMAVRQLRPQESAVLLVDKPDTEMYCLQQLAPMLDSCRCLFLDLMGASAEFRKNLEQMLHCYTGVVLRAQGSMPAHGQDPRQGWLRIYWRNADTDSIAQMLDLMGDLYGVWPSQKIYQPPRDLSRPRLEWPEHPVSCDASGDSLRVTILYSPQNYPVDMRHVVQSLAEAFAAKACQVFPLATPRLTPECITDFRSLLPQGTDILINLLSFRLGQGPQGGDAGPALELLEEMNAPLLHPVSLTRRTVADWLGDPHGCHPGEFMISIFLPEMDGAIESIPVAAVNSSVVPGGSVQHLDVIPDRLDKVVQRAMKWGALRKKKNADKKIAVLLYDYPPGEGNLGHAAFLDTTSSVIALLDHLRAQGYTCPPLTASELHHGLQSLATVVRSTPEDHPCAERTSQEWGLFPGDIYGEDDGVALPGMILGNVYLGVQPARRQGVISAKDYHREDLAPHHQYLAMYRWVEQEFAADALIHVGTHGTMEFTPGKENVPGRSCFPDYLVGSMPHIYLYYSGNPSEAMIAKRRAHAVLVGHLHAPMEPSGFYGPLLDLEALLQEFLQAQDLQPARCDAIWEDVRSRLLTLGWDCRNAHELHERIEEMRSCMIPVRLHILGQPFSAPEIDSFICYTRRLHSGISAEQLELLRCSLGSNSELHAVSRLLCGGYLPAGLAGDPFRNPEVLPSGRNLVQFDPRHIPSPSAERNGCLMAESNLAVYRELHGDFPQSVAVVLWGLETSRTQGESIAMILCYLGVRLLRSSPWQQDLEVISPEELKRPRVDVQVQISGFLRDLFPQAILLIDRAVELVAGLHEDVKQNPVAAHVRECEQELKQGGESDDRVWDLARARVFGPRAGLYGTAINSLVKESEWRNKEELADAYLFSMRYTYTRQRYGEAQPELARRNLQSVELVSQVRGGMDHEVTDLDHYYEFLGGLHSSIVRLGGVKPMMRVCDSLTGSVRTESLEHSVQRGFRTRLLNPRWQDGMLSTAFHGAQQFSERMENMLALSALADAVDPALFDDAAQSLVLNPEMRERLRSNNPQAAMQIASRLLEAGLRGCWQPSADVVQALTDVLLDMEGEMEN